MQKLFFGFFVPFFFGVIFSTLVFAQTDTYTVPDSYFRSTGQTPPTSQPTTPVPTTQQVPTTQVTAQPTATPEQPGTSAANDRGFILGIGGASLGYEFINSLFLYGVSGDLGYRFSQKWAVLLFAELMFTSESGQFVVISNLIPQVKFNFYKSWYAVAGSGLFTVSDGFVGDSVGIGFTTEAGVGYDFYFGKNDNWLVSPKLGVNYSYLVDDNVGDLNFKKNYIAPATHVTISYQF